VRSIGAESGGSVASKSDRGAEGGEGFLPPSAPQTEAIRSAGATAKEISEAVAKAGEGEPGRVCVGPLRTSMYGTGTAWAVCPARMAVRAAAASGLTIGWAQVGISLIEEGDP